MGTNQKNLIVISVDESPELTLDELRHTLQISDDFIQELIDFGIIDLKDQHIPGDDLRRIRKVLRLQQDLEVNLAGVAVILDLMDEMEEMRARLTMLEKFFNAKP